MYNHKLDPKVLLEMIMMMSERREKRVNNRLVNLKQLTTKRRDRTDKYKKSLNVSIHELNI